MMLLVLWAPEDPIKLLVFQSLKNLLDSLAKIESYFGPRSAHKIILLIVIFWAPQYYKSDKNFIGTQFY